MAKRFVDSEIFRSPSIRSLEAPYKLLWFYLLSDCDHAGIWIPDFEIASIYLDRKYNKEESLKALKGKIVEIEGGKKWWIPSFVEFQYGLLNPENRAHKSVLAILGNHGLLKNKGLQKPLPRPSRGCKDKDKDKDKEYSREFGEWWAVYKKGNKSGAFNRWKEQKPILPENLIALTRQYLNYCKKTDRAILDGQGFLNSKAWETEWTEEAQGFSEKSNSFANGTKDQNDYSEIHRNKNADYDNRNFG